MKARHFASLAAVVALAACSQPEERLAGPRIPVAGAGADLSTSSSPRSIALPAQQANRDWTQRGGSAPAGVAHPALGGALAPLFAVDIGAGDSRQQRITADPVVSGGRVFTLDSENLVSAVSTSGELLWQVPLATGTGQRSGLSGGGLAATNGRLYVSTGFGEVTALDAATGGRLWAQDLDAPAGAPTIENGTVYIASRNALAWALDANTGRIDWTLRGVGDESGVAAAAGAAVQGDLAVFPFSSGQVLGAYPNGGLQRWSSVVAGTRVGRAVANVTDISSDPVFADGRVYVSNIAGQIAALDPASGETIWSNDMGAMGPIWPVAGSLFLVNDLNRLVRLDAASGRVIWQAQLPGYAEENPRKQETFYAHYGPIVAGGRVLVASSDGVLRQFDPANGALAAQRELPGGASTEPVVAGQTLYVVSKDGKLLAFR